MKIAVISREMAPGSTSATALWARCTVNELLHDGHEVHLITQSLSREPAYEAQGLLTIRRIALPAPVVEWERRLLDFSAMAAALARELHDRGAVDIAIVAQSEAPAITLGLASACAGSRPPFVVATLPERERPTDAKLSSLRPIERLAESLANGVADDAAARGAVAEVFRSLTTAARARAATDRLAAWRRAQAAAGARSLQEQRT